MTEASEPTMHIGELAERTGLSQRTIRHYDEIGLLVPSGRTDGGFRLYTNGDFERLMVIRRMKPLGFTLEEMGELLAAIGAPRGGDPSQRVREFILDAERRRSQLQEQLAMADEFLDLLRRHDAR